MENLQMKYNITEQELNQAIDDLMKEIVKICIVKMCNPSLLLAITDLLTYGDIKAEWISVQERTPVNNETVIVYLESTCGGGNVYCMGSYHDDKFWFLSTNNPATLSYPHLQYEVKAWMKLPRLYEEEYSNEARME